MNTTTKRSVTVTVLIIIIILLLIVLGTYVYITQQALSGSSLKRVTQPVTVSSTTTPIPVQTPLVAAPSANGAATTMRTYVDAEVGFEFNYPDGWLVSRSEPSNKIDSNVTQGRVLADLLIGPADTTGNVTPEILVQEVHSASASITDTYGTGMDQTYFYDFTAHAWKAVIGTANGGRITQDANVSNNTMGGLHILTETGTSYIKAAIIPLSAYDFLVVSRIAHQDPWYLARTVIALDQDVAVRASSDDQQSIMEVEAMAYSYLPSVTWRTYKDQQTGISFKYPMDFGMDTDANLMSSDSLGAPQVIVTPTAANIDTTDGCYVNNDSPQGFNDSQATINGMSFCLSQGDDVSMGQAYHGYDYTIHHNGVYVTLGYAVHTSNGCGAMMGDPEYAVCSYYQGQYDSLVVPVIKESAGSLSFSH